MRVYALYLNFIRIYAYNLGIKIVVNPFYEMTNVLGSLWFAKDLLINGFYFIHADIFFEPLILGDLINKKGNIVLCVEKKKTVVEEMKVQITNGLVNKLSKEMPC